MNSQVFAAPPGSGDSIAKLRRIAVVLGGGGLKGFAHIGVLRALEERGIQPAVVAGTSIGALIAAAYAGGMSIAEMERRALDLRKADLFRLDHVSMLTRRLLAPSLYLAKPLRQLIDDVVPAGTFRDLPRRLLVNTVDLESACQVLWGLPGLQDVTVADAVYASCALPGFFPPGVLGGRTCADGGISDNVPALVASQGMDAVIAVDVGSSSLTRSRRIGQKGFTAIYMRAAEIMMRTLLSWQLENWRGPPLLLVRPAVWRYNWFSFAHVRRMIELGYEAAIDALDRSEPSFAQGGIWPRHRVEISVDRAACTGCGLCATLAPRTMAMDRDGKAAVRESPVEWSRADGDYIHQCPVNAIRVRSLQGQHFWHVLQTHLAED
jgi:NTE family protein